MLNDLVSFYLAVCSLSRGWTCTTSELVSVPYHSPFNSSFMMSPRPLPKHVTTVLKKRSRLPHAQRIEFKSSSATAKVNQGPVLILRPLSRSPCPGTRIYSVLIIPREPFGLHAFSDGFLPPPPPPYPLDVPSSTPLVGLTCPFLAESSLTQSNGTAHSTFVYSHIDLFSSVPR